MRTMVNDDLWAVHPQTGFLIHPEPLLQLHTDEPTLAPVLEQVDDIAAQMPALIRNGELRQVLEKMPLLDTFYLQRNPHPHILERLFRLYGYFASGYVFMSPYQPVPHLPVSIALPLVDLAQMVQRPPVLAYTGMALSNWRKLDLFGDLSVENIGILQTFTDLRDEQWFFIIHVAIEARAGGIIHALYAADDAVRHDDDQGFLTALHDINQGVIDITRIFNRMPEHCDPDIYYQLVRPYLFGLTAVEYEGVATFNGMPQSYRGGSGAQSSLIPALVAGLGIQHSRSGLVQYLETLHDYMPQTHRELISNMKKIKIRDFAANHTYLKDAYNTCLKQLITFRRAHFHYARTYIFEKSTNPTAAGGTPSMEWLDLLIQETQSHLL